MLTTYLNRQWFNYAPMTFIDNNSNVATSILDNNVAKCQNRTKTPVDQLALGHVNKSCFKRN